jgi:hypothetical protein
MPVKKFSLSCATAHAPAHAHVSGENAWWHDNWVVGQYMLAPTLGCYCTSLIPADWNGTKVCFHIVLGRVVVSHVGTVADV